MARTAKSTPPDEGGHDPVRRGPVRAEERGAPTAADLEAVAGAVEEALAGVRILDRALVFDDGSRADLAGVDSSGRVVLVRLASDDGDRATLGVLDLMAFARGHVELIARHLGAPRSTATVDPRVIVILEPADEVLAARLGAVTGAGLELYDLRTVKSAAGERAYLVARSSGMVSGVDVQATLQRFLDTLPPEKEQLGRELVARLARLDDELRTEATADAVAWFFRDRPLVRLESKSGRLSGAVGSDGRALDLSAPRDADELLEAAVTRLMEEVGRLDEGGEDGDEPDAALEGREPPLALLSPEEIEAFRD